MDRLKGIASLLVIAGAWLLLLRLVHLAVPMLYPAAFTGPISVDDFEAAGRHAGFSPRLPYYRPAALGTGPVHITASRRPRPKVVTFWQGERFLYLAEREGGPAPSRGVRGTPLEGRPGSRYWRAGETHHVVLELDGHWIEIRTDLTFVDVERIVDTLTPYRELL